MARAVRVHRDWRREGRPSVLNAQFHFASPPVFGFLHPSFDGFVVFVEKLSCCFYGFPDKLYRNDQNHEECRIERDCDRMSHKKRRFQSPEESVNGKC